MQTIEEYQRYTRQLEGEVKKWHDAFDASEVMNRELAAENKRLKEKFAELHKTWLQPSQKSQKPTAPKL